MDEELATQLLKAASCGQMMVWLTTPERAEEEWSRAINSLAQLHRERRVDVLEHLQRSAEGSKFHIDHVLWSRVYRDLIPLIDDEALRVASAVVCLSSGFWAPVVHDAFLDWCARDRERIDAVLELEPRPEIPDFCFAAALIAGLRIDPTSYFDAAVEFAQGNRRSRMPGIRAMAAMSIDEDFIVQRALSVLGSIAEDVHAPPRDRADALDGAVELAQRCGGPLDGRTSAMVQSAIMDRQGELLHTCCLLIVRFGAKLRDGLLASLLEALRCLVIDSDAARSSLDMALYSLLTTGRRNEALSCLETLLRNSTADNPLEALGSTTHQLATATADLLPTVICQWLLTGERALCAAARHLLISTGNQKLAFDFDAGNAGWPDSRTIYLARKAIGWLMPHSTAPTSFIVCLLRNASRAAGIELGNLLFDPLLVNYPLSARTYLETVCPHLPATPRSRVEEVLSRDDRYKQAIEKVGFVPELQPTERHRWIEAQRRAEEWDRARSAAEGKSVFAQMFSRQTLLYGTRAIDYVDDPGGGTRRLDNRLRTIRHTADNVMGWVYDPCGLDFVLWFFRAERKLE